MAISNVARSFWAQGRLRPYRGVSKMGKLGGRGRTLGYGIRVTSLWSSFQCDTKPSTEIREAVENNFQTSYGQYFSSYFNLKITKLLYLYKHRDGPSRQHEVGHFTNVLKFTVSRTQVICLYSLFLSTETQVG